MQRITFIHLPFRSQMWNITRFRKSSEYRSSLERLIEFMPETGQWREYFRSRKLDVEPSTFIRANMRKAQQNVRAKVT